MSTGVKSTKNSTMQRNASENMVYYLKIVKGYSYVRTGLIGLIMLKHRLLRHGNRFALMWRKDRNKCYECYDVHLIG